MGEIQQDRGEIEDARESYQQALEFLTEEMDLYSYVSEKLAQLPEIF
jgi:hypothetical protein